MSSFRTVFGMNFPFSVYHTIIRMSSFCTFFGLILVFSVCRTFVQMSSFCSVFGPNSPALTEKGSSPLPRSTISFLSAQQSIPVSVSTFDRHNPSYGRAFDPLWKERNGQNWYHSSSKHGQKIQQIGPALSIWYSQFNCCLEDRYRGNRRCPIGKSLSVAMRSRWLFVCGEQDREFQLTGQALFIWCGPTVFKCFQEHWWWDRPSIVSLEWPLSVVC